MMNLHVVLGAAIGYVAGAFTPSIGRKIKALFVKEATVVETKVATETATLEKKL